MFYENMPLYPGMRPPCGDGECMRVRLFEDGCGHRPPPMRECERVMIDNPCRPGERAEVTLGVDDCGSLVICVHRLRRWDEPCNRPDRCRIPCKPRQRCRPGCWD